MFDEERTSELMIYTQTQSPRGGGEAGGTPVQRQSFVADLHRFGVRKQPGIPGLPGNTESSILEMGIRGKVFGLLNIPVLGTGFHPSSGKKEKSRYEKVPLFSAIPTDVGLGPFSFLTSDEDGGVCLHFHTFTLSWSGSADRFLLKGAQGPRGPGSRSA